VDGGSGGVPGAAWAEVPGALPPVSRCGVQEQRRGGAHYEARLGAVWNGRRGRGEKWWRKKSRGAAIPHSIMNNFGKKNFFRI